MTFTASARASLALCVLLVANAAAADRVVVLEFQGDKRGKLRSQVERALKKVAEADVVPIARWKSAAAKKKLKGSAAMTPRAVKLVAPGLKVDLAVEGAVADTFLVRFVDPTGNPFYSKDLPLERNGLLSPKNAFKLAKAIGIALKQKPGGEAAAEASEEEGAKEEAPAEEAPAEKPEETAAAEPPKEEQPPAEEAKVEEKKSSEVSALPPVDVTPPDAEQLTDAERERRRREELAEAHTYVTPEVERDEDLETERRRKGPRIGPKLVSVGLSGTTTWRAYCSRPGVTSCKEYDTRPDPKPRGDTVDFSPQVPYAGFAVGVDAFPLASFDNPAKGLGLLGGYARGFSLTNVRVTSPSGDTPEKQVISVDEAFSGQVVYRFYFAFGEGREAMPAYVGVRGGIATRFFEVDPNAQVPLPGSHRVYPMVGADASLPLAKLVRVEAGGTYFVNPKAGPDEIAGYGDPNAEFGGAAGRGFAFEAGLAGDIWGPFGYSLRFRLASYSDQFYGRGQKWPCDETQCGGAAQETYSGLTWGLTAAF